METVKSGRAKHRVTPLLAGSVLILALLAAGISTRASADAANSGGIHPLGVGLEWSTYMGGSGYDEGMDIAVDGAGNVFVTGYTESSGWVSGGFDTTYNGGYRDAFVVKLSESGAHLWSTYLGGDHEDWGRDIALDSAGNVFVTGGTFSSGWVSGGFDTTFEGWADEGIGDGFVAKLSGSGLHLWSTYLGGRGQDLGTGIAVDDAGNVLVTGHTSSSDWISGGFDTVLDGDYDAFVVKLSGNGAHLWSTYLGGSDRDFGMDIALDGAGNVFVTGGTFSSGWVSGGFDTTHNGGTNDAFVVGLSESGAHLWSTYLGGSKLDGGNGIAVDGAGNVFVAGITSSSDWVSGGFDTTYNGVQDAFAVKLSGSGAHLWSTYLGGTEEETYGSGPIAVDGGGNVFVTGTTLSPRWVSGGFDPTCDGWDTFVVKFSGSGAHLWSTYLGGNDAEWGNGIAVDGAGNVFVAGGTGSSGWVSGGYDVTLNGSWDAFVAKIKDGPPLTGSLCITINPSECVAAGAKWRRAGMTNWLDSGYTESGIPTGVYAMEFTDIPGWIKPGIPSVNILSSQTANGSGIYRRLGIVWSTYLGRSDDDSGSGIAVDGAGNVFVTGSTHSSGWVSGGSDTTYNGSQDVFVAKLSGSGAHLWSTYLGGSHDDKGIGIAVDGTGNVFVTGYTSSSGWVSGGFDTTFNGVFEDAFVAKLSGSGAHLWSTYLGGNSWDRGYGIAVDGAGNVFVTGHTTSSGWVSGGFDTIYNGDCDTFVAKLSGSGSHLWSTYLGGSFSDYGYAIAVDGAGDVLVTGSTDSSVWVSGGFDTTYNGGVFDAFVAKLSGSGAHLWSTYLGGGDYDRGNGIAVDGVGNVFVTGTTSSSGWVSGGFDTTYNGGISLYGGDAFVVKLSGNGSHLWSTYLGGSDVDIAYAIAGDGRGNVFVTGDTRSSGWVSGGFDTSYNGSGLYEGDAFVVKLSGNGSHLWSAYLGGSDGDYGNGITVDAGGNVFATGTTKSSGWVSNGFDTTYSGSGDAFLAKIQELRPPSKVAFETWQLYE